MEKSTKREKLIKEYIDLKTKKILKESFNESETLLDKAHALDFDTEEEYFDYIVDSISNGQIKQAKELYNELSAEQKLEFNDWYCVFVAYDKDDMTETQALNDMLNYLNN